MFLFLCSQCCLPASYAIDKSVTLRRLGRPQRNAEQPWTGNRWGDNQLVKPIFPRVCAPSVYTNKTISFLSKVYQIICIFYVLCFRNAVSCICSAWILCRFSVKRFDSNLAPSYNSLLTTLNLALQNSGIDLSEASVSVQINLGKRAIKRFNNPGPNPTSKVGVLLI